MSTTALRVVRLAGDDVLARHADVLDALNLAAAVPSPFHTSSFLRTYAANSEHLPDGIDVRLFIVVEGFEAIGWLAMRARTELLGGRLPARRLELLAIHDNDRPGIVAVAGREREVAGAILDHLVRHEHGWSLCELRAQEPGAAMHTVARRLATARVRVRDIRIDPYTEVALHHRDLAGYFAALSKRMRSNVSRQARRLYAAGEVELVLAEGGLATGALFDAYLELESRSRKHGSDISVRRHPNRERFYRELARGRAGLAPSFIGVALDRQLVAGLVNGHFHGRSWCMEMAFDASRHDLGPGQLLLLLTMGDAIERGSRSVNFLQMDNPFKRRWLAEPVEVVNVQLLRRPSLHAAKAAVGDAQRRRAGATAGSAAPVAPDASDDGDESAANHAEAGQPPALRPVDPSLGRSMLRGVLAQQLPGVRVLDAEAAQRHLPFPLR